MAKSTVKTLGFKQIRGSSLEVDTVTLTIGAGVNVPALTPIALDSSNNQHFPFDPAGTNGRNRALYLSAFPINTTTGGAAKHALIRKGGFNIDAINWPAATYTFDKKQAVFAGTPISVNQLDG